MTSSTPSSTAMRLSVIWTTDWLWGAAEQQAFDVLKSAVTSAPMLTFPSKSGPFCLECDASNFAMGAVLSQQQEDGVNRIKWVQHPDMICNEAWPGRH